MLNMAVIYHSAVSQIPVKSSVPFFTPILPTDYDLNLMQCNFIQSANFEATIWQCIMPQPPKPLPTAEGNANEIVWMIPINSQGKLGNPRIFDPLKNFPLHIHSLIGEILAIDHDHRWIVRGPAQMPANAVNLKQLFWVNLRIHKGPEDRIDEIPIPFTFVQMVFSLANGTYLIKDILNPGENADPKKNSYITLHRLNNIGLPLSTLTFNPETTGIYSEPHVIIGKNNEILLWGKGNGGNKLETTAIFCAIDGVKNVRNKIDFPADQVRIGLTLPNNEILLLGTQEENGHSFLMGWYIDIPNGCQSRLWAKIQLPEHRDGLETYSWLEHAVVTREGEVIAFYAQQWDIRHIRFFVAPPPEATRPDLWAMKFTPLSSPEIIWDKLVIASSDPASEAFSANPHQDQRFSMAFFPKLGQIWLHPMVYKTPEAPTYYPAEPRIYKLPLE